LQFLSKIRFKLLQYCNVFQKNYSLQYFDSVRESGCGFPFPEASAPVAMYKAGVAATAAAPGRYAGQAH
jgi:hypothetical protein